MPIQECVCPAEIMCKHGCSYVITNLEGRKVCGSKCAQLLIAENKKLREENEQLKTKLNEILGEI